MHTERDEDVSGHRRSSRESEGVEDEGNEQSVEGDTGDEQPARECVNPRK